MDILSFNRVELNIKYFTVAAVFCARTSAVFDEKQFL